MQLWDTTPPYVCVVPAASAPFVITLTWKLKVEACQV